MIRIGNFARLVGLTVKTLRHCEAEGLLRPRRVDPQSGYRYYAAEQVATGQRIAQLRLGWPLDDIRTLLASAPQDHAV